MRLCPIFKWSEQAPGKPAVSTPNEMISYRQLNHLIQLQCGYIKSLNLPKQSRLVFIAENSVETLCFFFAAWRMQMIACPLSFRLPSEAVSQTLKRLNSSLLVPQMGQLEKAEEIDEDLLATMLLTSGSTGQPKIACHRLRHLLTSAQNALVPLNLESHDYYLASLPYFHVGGISLLLRTFLCGATLFLSQNYFDPRITHLSLVPTQLYRLLQEKPEHFHPKCLLLGGAPIPSRLIEESANLNLYTTYGMTETSSMIIVNGKVLDHLELKLGKDEEILIRGKSLFEGYLNSEGMIESPLIDGWFHTKDRGSLNTNGELQFLGRKDRLFISGGENIQPEEIEEAILSIFKLKQALIIPYQDEEFGMRPAAYLYDPDQRVSLLSLQKELKRILPGYKIPQKLFYLSHIYTKEEIKNLI
ncbi:MAG TPA: AMP-binding protein [Rhabdochlamydiaceae bacterium]|nr:AMP-binding protein [Rhabdochlamydiaceae bacterium]